MDNYYNYFTEIEEHFIRKRGRNLLVSPLDWCLIDLWKSSEIPLHVVLRGIDRSFESAEKSRRRTPKTLFYCHPAVMEAFEEYQESQVGAESEQPQGVSSLSRRELIAHLQRLAQSVSGRSEEVFRRAEGELEAVRAEVDARERLDLQDIDATLNRLADMIAEALFQDLEPDQRKAVKKEIRSDLRIYRKRLSGEAAARLELNYRNRLMRRRSGVPEFSLFEMGQEVS